jgi:uncharacterized membrane protein YczE
MSGAWDRAPQRTLRLAAGVVLFGIGLAALVQADHGLDPWTVFQQGLADHTGMTIGTATIVCSLAVLATWIPLAQRPGIGTIANALGVGPVLDLTLTVLPAPDPVAARLAYVAAGILGVAVATGLYVGAGWGPGPRDGLMTGLAARGIPIAVARGSIEVSVLVAGWLLGGTVGVATVLYATTIGALVKRTLPRFALPPAPAPSALAAAAPAPAPAASGGAPPARR